MIHGLRWLAHQWWNGGIGYVVVISIVGPIIGVLYAAAVGIKHLAGRARDHG